MAYKSKFDDLEKDLMECCRTGHLHLLPDGKLRLVLSKYVLYWYHIKPLDDGCVYWHAVINLPMFGFGKSFVPQRCQNCWKVVANPRTYEESRKLLEIMKELDLESKIGTEARLYVPQKWGAYFYNHSKEEGLACYEKIRELVDTISPDIRVILKRGCTEYELGENGPSDKWRLFDGQVAFEKYLEDRVEVHCVNRGQSDFIKNMVLEQWMAWAHSTADMSYVPYNEGKKLMPEYVTYHPNGSKK